MWLSPVEPTFFSILPACPVDQPCFECTDPLHLDTAKTQALILLGSPAEFMDSRKDLQASSEALNVGSTLLLGCALQLQSASDRQTSMLLYLRLPPLPSPSLLSPLLHSLP